MVALNQTLELCSVDEELLKCPIEKGKRLIIQTHKFATFRETPDDSKIDILEKYNNFFVHFFYNNQ